MPGIAGWLAGVSVTLAALSARAQVAPPIAPGLPQPPAGTPPTYQLLRQDEDWRQLLATTRSDPRALPLGSGDVVLSLGGDLRLRTIFYDAESFGDVPGRTLSDRARLNLHAALWLGDRLRLYAEVKSAHVFGDGTGDPVVEQDGPDLHQAFAELSVGDAVGLARSDILVRIGRQELHYGSGRLLSVREGPAVRDDQNGALVRLRAAGWVADAFATVRSQDTPGVFNNRVDWRRPLWGVYASRPFGGANLDLGYIGFHEPTGSYARGPVKETRHSLGARLWSSEPKAPHPVFDVEADVQVGRFEDVSRVHGAISAWSISGGMGYAFSTAPWQPRPGLDFGVTSGDAGPGADTLGTFRSPEPSGQFFGETNPLGPGNLWGVRPLLELHPTKALTIRPLIEYFWRLRRSDGVYGASSFLLRPAGGDRDFVGHESGVVATYDMGPHVSLFGRFGVFDRGGFLVDHPPNNRITTAEFRITFRE